MNSVSANEVALEPEALQLKRIIDQAAAKAPSTWTLIIECASIAQASAIPPIQEPYAGAKIVTSGSTAFTKFVGDKK